VLDALAVPGPLELRSHRTTGYVDLRLPEPRVDGPIETHDTGLSAELWSRIRNLGQDPEPWEPDIFVDGLTPNIVKWIDRAGYPHWVSIAGIDCVLRAHIVAVPGISRLEDLKGKRIGISGRTDTTTGYGVLMLAERMGWDPKTDIWIKRDGRNVEDLLEGKVDAIVASETRYAVALKEDLNVLADTMGWGLAIGGNSAMVEAGWLDDDTNREAARRFLKATVEGLALFHNDKDLALSVMQRWYGIDDPEIAETIYARGQFLERRPYSCYQGILNTFETYDSSGMRQHRPEDFFDDSLLRELEADGFFDTVGIGE
jgi:ABC-type amino acid transport substrate-binding protein